jgi:chromosome segregation ATPase
MTHPTPTREEVERLSIELGQVNATAKATYPYQGYLAMDAAARLLRALLDAKEQAEAERDALRKERDEARRKLENCEILLAQTVNERDEADDAAELCCAGQDDLRKELETALAQVAELRQTLALVESVYRQNCVAEGEPSPVLEAMQAALASTEEKK